MRKLSVSLLLITLAATNTFADLALGGGHGLYRVQDARVEDEGALVFANRWVFKSHGGKSEIWTGPLYGMEMNYTPTDVVEVFGSALGVAQKEPDIVFYDNQGYTLGSKVSYPYFSIAKLGASVHYVHEVSGRVMENFLDSRDKPGISWRALTTLELSEVHKTLPTVSLNVGQRYGEDPSSMLGVGVEMASSALSLFVEATSDGASFGDVFGSNARARITPGVRVKFPYLHLDGGVEFGLTDAVPAYEAILGFSVVSPFPMIHLRTAGKLAGKVLDSETGMPVAAELKFSNKRARPLESNPETGVYFLERAPTGAFVLEASAEGYLAEAVPLAIDEGNLTTHTFHLIPKTEGASGLLMGDVIDRNTGEPLAATVTFMDYEHPPLYTTADAGQFKALLPPGAYKLSVDAEGYESAHNSVSTTRNDTTKRTYQMVKRGTHIPMRGVYFDFGTATLTKESYPALMEIAQSIQQNPNMRVEIHGHTDNVGSADLNLKLSERRAYAVANFLARYGSISPNRLKIQGCGESEPVAPNDTKEGRQLNRRVELVVMD